MPLGDHLEDLRKRVVFALLGLVPILVGSLLIGRTVLDLLIEPVQAAMIRSGLSAAIQATSPLETFYAYLRVSIVLTLLVGSPWVIWHLWQFIRPGLYKRERRFVNLLVPISGLLTLSSVLFLYYVIMPVILAFFIRFGGSVGVNDVRSAPVPADVTMATIPVLDADPETPNVGEQWINTSLNQLRVCVGRDGDEALVVASQLVRGYGIQQQYRVAEYIKLFLQLALAFAVGFQTPVVVLLLGWAGLIDRKTLSRYRKQAVMGAAVAGMLLTPADPLSMLLMAAPLYVLYELGMLLLIVMPADRVAKGTVITGGRERDDAGDE